jgi:hypothetical protein
VLRLYLAESGMNTAMDEICAQYDEEDLELGAGRDPAQRLTAGLPP